MMRNTLRPTLPLLVLLLAACNPTSMTLTGDRAAARDVALQIVSRQDPVLDPAPIAQCIGASATPSEATALADAGRMGTREEAEAAMTKILRKTNTQACLASVGVPDYL